MFGLSVQSPCQAEVGYLGRVVAGQEDIGRFEIAVNDPARMGCLYGVSQGRHEFRGLAGGLGSSRQLLGQISTLDKFHGEIGEPIEIAHIVDLNDVLVPQTCDRFRFPNKSLSFPRTRVQARTQHLDRDRAIELLVQCLVHHPHPTVAHQCLHFVAGD